MQYGFDIVQCTTWDSPWLGWIRVRCGSGHTPLSFRVVISFCTGIELWRWASISCEDQATSPRWWRASIPVDIGPHLSAEGRGPDGGDQGGGSTTMVAVETMRAVVRKKSNLIQHGRVEGHRPRCLTQA